MRNIKSLLIYRMTHIDNIPYIVKNGLWAKLSGVSDPDFIPIGNSEIISRRTQKSVNVNPPGGVLGDFIPFYFSGYSPMLLNIATGYGVKLTMQKDIVFIVCDAIELINSGIPFCFTDGNATQRVTKFYNNLLSLNALDWSTIRAKIWKNTDEDYDRVRKKMSEFLVKGHIPPSLVKQIIVRNEDAEKKVLSMLEGHVLDCSVKIDAKNEYYYRQYD